MQCLQFGFSEFLYIFIHTKCQCKLQHTWEFEEFGFKYLVNATFAVWILQIFVHTYPYKMSMQITTYLGL